MNYTIIDLNNWKRGQLFNHFVNELRIVMSMTVDIDITKLKNYTQRNGVKFYHAMLWIVSKVINSHDEFKYSWNENGDLIRWDYISPSYVDFHEEDETFIKIVTEYSDDLTVFCHRIAADIDSHKNTQGIADDQPPNFFDVSCLPWVKYTNYDIHVFDEGKCLSPVVNWGKYEEENNKLMMPLTMNIHHAVADGFHLSRFFNEVQELINSLQ